MIQISSHFRMLINRFENVIGIKAILVFVVKTDINWGRDRKSKRCRRKERERDVNRNVLVQQSNFEIRTKSPDVKHWYSIEFRKLTVVANWASAALSWRIPTKILQFLEKENQNGCVIIRISKKNSIKKEIWKSMLRVFFSLYCLMRPLKVSRKAMKLTLFKHDGWFLLRCTSNWKKKTFIQLVCWFFTVASVPYITHRIHRRI